MVEVVLVVVEVVLVGDLTVQQHISIWWRWCWLVT